MQQIIEDAERDSIFKKLTSNPENNKCFDCDKKNPKWASVYLGLYLCLDCAGKHRQYGPQISFVRSLNFDTWNKRYITFMEFGGNPKALEYFKKQNLKAPYDYMNPAIQKYKQELTKKVDKELEDIKPKVEEAKPNIVINEETEKPKGRVATLQTLSLNVKSHSDKPKQSESLKDDSSKDSPVINKDETKTKAFAVKFNNKSSFAPGKGRIAAKKIENIDLDTLSLNEDGGPQALKSKFGMADSSMGTGMSNKGNIKQVYSKTNDYVQPDNDKLKAFQNAKAISSESFKNDNRGYDPSHARKFVNANSISSAQYFGENTQEHEDEIDYHQAAEDVKDFLNNVGGKLKKTVDVFVDKMKEEFD